MFCSLERLVFLKEQMRLEDALPLMEAAFSAGASFRFFQRGTSMLPMLRQGIDSVSIVSPQKREAKVGEVILYRRKNGAFVLHRAIDLQSDGKFICRGDNQGVIERDVSPDSVIGVLEGYYRDDKWISADDADYKRYVKRRMATGWIRRLKGILRSMIK